MIEFEWSMLGVPGRMRRDTTCGRPVKPGCWALQKWKSESRPIEGYGRNAALRVEVRFDDECRNGHNTFTITAEVRIPGRRDIEACGCLHEDIAEVFPELAPLIKWHLVSSDGPMHYLANTLYHASDRDHWGLRKGERRQIRNGKTGQLAWKLSGHDLPQYVDSDERPLEQAVLYYEPWEHVGEGKERELDKARACAVWPEATDEELMAPDLEKKLIARLPQLLKDFRLAMEDAGFLWEPPTK